MEYLPFGETLVDEHQNSYNTPYKFNAKERDQETGNYYYGARYYSPKWSIWLSVDAWREDYPGWSSYNYTFQNPVMYTDPTGNGPNTWILNAETGAATYIDDGSDDIVILGGNDYNSAVIAGTKAYQYSGKCDNNAYNTYQGLLGNGVRATTNKHGMVELPHDGSVSTAYGSGSLSFSGNKIYDIYNYEGNDQYGSPSVVADIISISIQYRNETGGYLAIGDLSRPNGSTFAPHKSHKGGTQFDYRYALGGANSKRGYYSNTKENLSNLQTLVNISYENGMRNFILPSSTRGKIINPANNLPVNRNYSKRSGKKFGGSHWLFGAGHEDHGHTGR